MAKAKNNQSINVKGTEIALYRANADDYISLTDMAKHKNAEIPATVISHWMSTNFSINYMGLWERMNNSGFNVTGFREVKMLSTEPGFALSPKQWIAMTNATGITSKAGRYGGGTFAHRNIAFEFASWLSPEFKYYLISEFERMKSAEVSRQSLEWNLQRTISKINYRIHTDAIKEHIIPPVITKEQAKMIYASEADMLLPRQLIVETKRRRFSSVCEAAEPRIPVVCKDSANKADWRKDRLDFLL
ncbi:MAG: KilA-N domain-containing protein [Clostridiales Family XIII bacterium]|nr:KilA-N domain-containing protein [Clostridiales Family XIII bacterium]